MVTSIKGKTSIHANGATVADQNAKEDAIKTMTATTKNKVTDAIKARKDSFILLQSAAAYAIFLGIVHGRWEQMNRLFNELPTIDADALRQKFAFRVNDKYAVDGKHELDTMGNELATWEKRPTTMIVFLANPTNKGEHFSLAKADDKNTEKKELISKYRAKVEAAGVEDLEAIEWLSREKVIQSTAGYDVQSFQKELARVLTKAAKATGDNESHISIALIESIMRDAAMPKALSADVRNAYAADPTAKPALKTEGEKSEIPANHPSQTVQAENQAAA